MVSTVPLGLIAAAQDQKANRHLVPTKFNYDTVEDSAELDDGSSKRASSQGSFLPSFLQQVTGGRDGSDHQDEGLDSSSTHSRSRMTVNLSRFVKKSDGADCEDDDVSVASTTKNIVQSAADLANGLLHLPRAADKSSASEDCEGFTLKMPKIQLPEIHMPHMPQLPAAFGGKQAFPVFDNNDSLDTNDQEVADEGSASDNEGEIAETPTGDEDETDSSGGESPTVPENPAATCKPREKRSSRASKGRRSRRTRVSTRKSGTVSQRGSKSLSPKRTSNSSRKPVSPKEFLEKAEKTQELLTTAQTAKLFEEMDLSIDFD